jgi:hypothetical protein
MTSCLSSRPPQSRRAFRSETTYGGATPSALGYWKLAIILEGVYARYASGQYGKTDEGFQEFARIVERLADAAKDTADRLP